jgi:hypothetical protein
MQKSEHQNSSWLLSYGQKMVSAAIVEQFWRFLVFWPSSGGQ